MGVGYRLVNRTRREYVGFVHLPVDTRNEICGNPVSAAMVSWYLLTRQGDTVQFVSDTHGEWPFDAGTEAELADYTEVTDGLVAELVAAGILRDDGIAWADEDEPREVYMRAIRNVWLQA